LVGDLAATVIIPARNEADRIIHQLDALAAQDYAGAWEVVVVDNGSSDGTPSVARRYQSHLAHLRVVSAPDQRGVNYVRNVGARAARSPALLFCDADDVVSGRWVAAMVSGLERHDAVGGPLEFDTLNEPDNPGRIVRGALPPSDRLPTWYGFLPSAMGCNYGVRREVHERLGGFSESYARGGDETEFFWRLQLAGYDLGFVPGALVHYRLRRGVTANLKQAYGYHRSEPHLYKQFREHGFPGRSVREVAGTYLHLVRSAPWLLRGHEARLSWLAQAVLAWGRLVGSIRHRVFRL
jgi:glycosyltransferase involved in cell wall biosynthesis